MMDVRVCRICGCTDDDCSACIERVGVPCHWVAEDLCSACWRYPNATLVEAAAARRRPRPAARARIGETMTIACWSASDVKSVLWVIFWMVLLWRWLA